MSSQFIDKKNTHIPKIGLGTYKMTGKEGQIAIQNALEVGYRHIDTAKMYENETEVGQAIKNSSVDRNDIFITTKIWPTDFDLVVQKTEDSLRQLKTDHVDLLLLHWPSTEEMNKRGADLLNEVLHKQYAKAVGVSNFNIQQVSDALKLAPIVCNQVEYHPYLEQEKLLNFLYENDLFLTAYRPLMMGKILDDAQLLSLAKEHNKTVSQIVLRWMMQQKDIAVIPKSSNSERQIENLNVFDFELSKNEMELISHLNCGDRTTNPEMAPIWD
jgi:2,5-diketo-D-gluconate reductase B